MVRHLRAPFRLQPVDDLLHLLRPFAVGHQHRVLGVDHYRVLHPDQRYQPRVGEGEAIAGIMRQYVAAQGIARLILVPHLPKRGP